MAAKHARTQADAGFLAASLLRGVPKEQVVELAAHALHRTLRADELLWRAGDAAHYFTIVVRGLVRVERSTPSGEQSIVAIFGPRESIGETAAVRGEPYPASALATSASVEVLQLAADSVRAAMERDPRVAEAIHAVVLSHTDALRAKIDIMSAGSVPARLASLLLHLAERFGDEDEAGSTRIPVQLSRTALARLISARVETVIRTLSAWQRAGLVRSSEAGFEIADCARLRELVTKG